MTAKRNTVTLRLVKIFPWYYEFPLLFNSQLLATALKHEKPELELRKSELLKVEEEHKLEIGRLEDFLLEELANATGNLLENKELLASLNETKAKSASIKVSIFRQLKGHFA